MAELPSGRGRPITLERIVLYEKFALQDLKFTGCQQETLRLSKCRAGHFSRSR